MGRKEGQGHGLLQGMEDGLANHKLLQPPGILWMLYSMSDKVKSLGQVSHYFRTRS